MKLVMRSAEQPQAQAHTVNTGRWEAKSVSVLGFRAPAIQHRHPLPVRQPLGPFIEQAQVDLAEEMPMNHAPQDMLFADLEPGILQILAKGRRSLLWYSNSLLLR